MTLQEYRACLENLPYGKRLPGALYVARDAASDFGENLNRLLAQLAIVFEIGPEFNLIKFRTNELKLSFLSYSDFFENPHPSLRHAVTIDLATGKARHTEMCATQAASVHHLARETHHRDHRIPS